MKPIFIENFFPEEILKVTYSYLVMKTAATKEFTYEPSSNTIASYYADSLCETLLDMSTPVVEQNVNKKLYPTYSFARIYDKGSHLPIHVDRGSCEYTVAICIGSQPSDVPYSIHIGKQNKNSTYHYIDQENEEVKLEIEHTFSMSTNNALIFQGLENLHWREKCIHDHFITVFLHYVDKEGEFTAHKYDGRELLGISDRK
tara:strand:+ start:729 stop:1331 length:603 start_codon:yes stop_codon:yes gene_type:complete